MLGFRSISELAISELPADLRTVTSDVVTRYASHSFVTRSDDTPAHAFIAGRIGRGVTIGRRIRPGAGGQFGAIIESRFGEIELSNVDGGLDSLIDDFFVDGREIRLHIGATETDGHGREKIQALADFELVYTAHSGVWEAEHDVIRLQVQDRGKALQDRLQTTTYGGGGGASGTADMTGRSLPVTLGRCLNITAQLVDASNLIFQIHDASVEAIDAVYDAGVSITPEGGGIGGVANDHADYAALAAASVTANTFATALADGMFRMGTTPVGMVTADVRGDNGDGYVDTHGAVLKRILLQYSPLTVAELDVDTFDDLAITQPASMGIYFPAGDRSSIEDAITRVAFSAGAFCGQDRSGLYRAQRLDAPTLIPDWTFNENEITRIERQPVPYRIPWKSWGVAYQRNWTVQVGGDVAGSVSQARRQFLEAEARYAFIQESSIAIAHLTSAAAPLRPSLFSLTAPAEAEAERLMAFYALGRALYRVTVKKTLFSMKIGETVELTYPRWNLRQGRNFVVVELEDDADKVETTMLVFG